MTARLDNRLNDENHKCVYVVWDTDHFSTYKIVPANAEGNEVSYIDNDGNQQFGTLKDAVANAKDGSTITLLGDVTVSGTGVPANNGAINISGKNLTIDGTS